MKDIIIVYVIALFSCSLSLYAIEPEEIPDYPMSMTYPTEANDAQTREARDKTQRYAKRFEIDLRKDKYVIADRADISVGQIIKKAIRKLKEQGYKAEADKITAEFKLYDGFILDYVYKTGDTRGIGDHPGIQWMLDVHKRIHDLLGETICRALRFHDLYNLAHCIPIVFECVDHVDLPEFSEHWNVFLGIVSYWVTDVVCLTATWGTGAVFLCGFVSMGVEQIVLRWIAPKIAEPAWNWSCNSQNYYVSANVPYGP